MYYSHCYQVTGEFDVERFLFTTHGFGYFLCVVPWNGQVVGFGLLTTGLIDLILDFVLCLVLHFIFYMFSFPPALLD